jgi:putative GTP pyrophosphokinase
MIGSLILRGWESMSTQNLSKTQIDRLGDRLRIDPRNQDDLILLDEFRRSFGPAYQVVVKRIRELKLKPTGRPEKSTPSVIEKLKRESIRLTQIQDIAGCRIVIPDIPAQNRTVDSLLAVLSQVTVADRRTKPSHGYRAVHLVTQISGMPVEIQIRTELQHAWAELSEKLADVVDSSIKYGGGPDPVKDMLGTISGHIATIEEMEYNLSRIKASGIHERMKAQFFELEGEVGTLKISLKDKCHELALWFTTNEDQQK